MLRSLYIKNFAIIEDVTLEWGEGLNVLSGETGAGKSMIVQALDLLTGGRGSIDWIRKGMDEAVVTGLFEIGDGELLIQRTFSRSGRNRIQIDGEPATIATLAKVSENLIDIVSQREHEALLRPDKQREVLDQFSKATALVAEYQGALGRLKGFQDNFEALEKEVDSNRRMEDFLKFQLQEIDAAKLKPGEEEELKAWKGRIKNASKLGEVCTFADEALTAEESSISGKIREIENRLGQASLLDPKLLPIIEVIRSVQAELDEVARFFSDYLGNLQFEPGRLDQIEGRLAEIDRLKKKYGSDVEKILSHAEETREKLGNLENHEVHKTELEEKIRVEGKELAALERQLQELRKNGAKRLEKEVMKELSDLGMEMALLEVRFEPVTTGTVSFEGRLYDSLGSSRALFWLAANPGEDAKPLVKIASGGERSRILLAMKKVLVECADLGISVYDEVDEGVGGMTANRIGEKLSEIARKRQVICITHLPQIAAYATCHFLVTKEFGDGKTRVTVQRLDGSRREKEIARMLAGKKVTERTREHAKEMLNL